MPEANQPLQSRIRKASTYFTEKIDRLLQETRQLSIASDNQEVAARLASQVWSLQFDCFVKRSCFAACGGGFNTEAYGRAKVNAELDFTKTEATLSRTPMVVPKGVPHPSLYRQLLEWREQAAKKNNVSPRAVLPNATLKQLVTYLPTENHQLRQITGIGKARLRRYGKALGELIRQYRQEQQIPENANTAPSPAARQQPRTSETKRISFEMFRAGKSLEEIAAERRLVRGTIEGHLSHFIALGELDVHEVLDRPTVSTIQQFLLAHPEASVAEAKAHFGDRFSYGQLKMVLSHVQRVKLQETTA